MPLIQYNPIRDNLSPETCEKLNCLNRVVEAIAHLVLITYSMDEEDDSYAKESFINAIATLNDIIVGHDKNEGDLLNL
tara:strand:- start:103 stop:336 length:234 start_codon:yes stop_codon:yes gene_type:complete